MTKFNDHCFNLMCVWEWHLESYMATRPHPINILREQVGASEIRNQFASNRQLINHVQKAFDYANELGYDDKPYSFDWDFVPWFMNECVTVIDKQIRFKSNYKELVEAMMDKTPTTPVSVDESDLYCAFLDKYMPITNYMDDNASMDGCMFETYGDEIDAVKAMSKLNKHHVWTIVDGDDGYPVVLSGFHYVNRIGYFITKLAWEIDDPNIICIPMMSDDEKAQLASN